MFVFDNIAITLPNIYRKMHKGSFPIYGFEMTELRIDRFESISDLFVVERMRIKDGIFLKTNLSFSVYVCRKSYE